MPEFTEAKLAELRAVAEAATPGEWSEKRVRAWDETYSEVEPLYAVTETTDSAPAHACAYPPEPQDATHIAAFDPPTTLALIAALEAKTAEAAQLKAELKDVLKTDIPTLELQRDEARAELDDLAADPGHKAAKYWKWWQREKARADRAEAALERVRAAATEVADHWGDQIGTHYDGCWRQHAACLAAQTLAETGADDD